MILPYFQWPAKKILHWKARLQLLRDLRPPGRQRRSAALAEAVSTPRAAGDQWVPGTAGWVPQWVVLPSGKLTYLWKITMFNGKTHYKWEFSIAMLVYQRVVHVYIMEHPING